MSDSLMAPITGTAVTVPQRSALRAAFDRAMGGGRLAKARRTAIETAHTVRGAAESGLVGAGLGFAHASMPNGLDYVVKPAQAAGTTPGPDGTLAPAKEAITVPIDGIVAAAGLVGAIALAGESDGISGSGVSADLRNVGMTALGVFAFRKSADMTAAARRKAGKPSGGTVPSAKSLIHSMMTAHGEGWNGEQRHNRSAFGASGFGAESVDPIVALGTGK